MTEITPEMLRRFAELGGFKCTKYRFMHPTEGALQFFGFRTRLQACFDVLVRMCEKLPSLEAGRCSWYWELAAVYGSDTMRCKIWNGDKIHGKSREYFEAEADTIQDAIILAVLKAAEGEAKS